MPNPEGEFSQIPLPHSTIRPIGVYALSGLAADGNHLLAVDAIRGYLVRIDPHTNNTTILNPHHVGEWIGVSGLSVWEDTFWFAKGQEAIWCDRQTLTPTVFTRLPYPVTGVAVSDLLVYVSCQKSGYIHIFDRTTGESTGRIPQPGVGCETLVLHNDALWVADRAEQTVYCLDRTTGDLKFSALTPFSSPTGIAFYYPTDGAEPICYVVYADEEPYIRDDPNAKSPYQLTFRDRTFIHPLYFHHEPEAHYTLSNGFAIELSYVEELLPLEAVALNQVEWRIALPSNTLRQRVRHVEAIGCECTIEEQDGQKVAVFKFDKLAPNQGGLLGWKAVIEMYGLKYSLSPDDIDDRLTLPAELAQLYLVDDDDLAMDTDTMIQAAKEAVGTETNVLRKMLKIRNYVYDRLSYGIQPKIDTPDIALARGVGSCGEYVGVLLALARLNGIACRTIGRYKCPPYPDRRQVPLQPDFNHVWLEFYIPGIGWLPMESNMDDTIERGPYPQRFFMGLAWYHTEIGKGISFEKMKAIDKPEHLSMGDLAINHICFRILDELMPS
ncbi:transglutaminase domain-containing protein [Chamaesiphon minutus]|uniref:Transglutaminase-like enzyme, predicted cysteine protease n=1 Tax=Chamaesiphon minutus (strain ATCC 27169 / PCC 6605) TaxID=1173020 RepID=K9UK24_CHAP6|nr:transglutaminase domain-containing protein [Chamaesiphon minutus]AFY95447.1 transglutaminase-like enzyme, predicted cysteine protease [Chamaesiphon minutus PCC 6605]